MYESVLESKREREIEESKIKTFYFPPTNFKKRFQERVERTVMGVGEFPHYCMSLQAVKQS